MRAGDGLVRQLWTLLEVAGMDEQEDRLLTPVEVADRFRVEPKTVKRWAKAGRLTVVRTPGGHHRYRESQVRKLLEGETSNVDI